MADIIFKSYPTMPPFGHKYRPADWPADEEYYEVFQTEDTGFWFMFHGSYTGGTSRTSSRKTRDEAIAEVWANVNFIREFWDEYVEARNNGDRTIKNGSQVVRVGHRHYVVGKQPSQREIQSNRQYGGLGHGGRKFTIKLNTGETIETINLWSQGQIPKEYWDALPDNAVFV